MKLFAVALVCAALFAQSPKPAARVSDDQARITLEVTRVNLLYTVSDKRGRFVTDLTKDDFEIFESKKPQSIIEFTAETNLPLRLAILIDTSNSIRDRFKFQQEAATDFINTVVRKGQDKAILASFDRPPERVPDLTDKTQNAAS